MMMVWHLATANLTIFPSYAYPYNPSFNCYYSDNGKYVWLLLYNYFWVNLLSCPCEDNVKFLRSYVNTNQRSEEVTEAVFSLSWRSVPE